MKHLKVLFLVAIVGLLVTGSMVMKNHHLLFSDSAKAGIFSLELTRSDSVQYRIFSEWNREGNYVFERNWKDPEESGSIITGLQTAKRQTNADFGFIFFYVSTFILLFWYFFKGVSTSTASISQRQFKIFAGTAVLIGVLDVAENFYILQAIRHFEQLNPNIPSMIHLAKFVENGVAMSVFYLALFKFILLGCMLFFFGWSISFFKRLTGWLSILSANTLFALRLSWTFRIVLIVLFVLFALLNFSDQGQDLLITINTSFWGTIIFLICISVLAALNWYLPKLYAGGFTDLLLTVPKGFSMQHKSTVDYARLLGVLSFLIPAVGILSTMKRYHMPYLLDDVPVLAILLAALIAYWQMLRHNSLDTFFAPNNIFSFSRYLTVMALLFAVMIGFYFIRNTNVEEYGRLSYLSLNLFLLSFAFLISVTYRSKIQLVKNIQVGPIVLISGLLLALVFILFNIPYILFALTAKFRFFTLAIAISALICYLLLFSYLLILGKRTNVQWITLLLLVGVSISYFKMSDFHKVHTVKAEASGQHSLRAHIRNWLSFRRGVIESYAADHGRPYPVFFVNSYGGGIRASVWATMIIGELDSRMLNARGSRMLADDFQHHVFSFSGASGGTVGFSFLTADRLAAENQLASTRFFPKNDEIYMHDYLTANVVGIFGRDVLMSVIGGNWYDDRSRLQEIGFEKILKEKYKMDYSVALRAAWKQSNMELPLLFSNTYDINTGKKGIVAPVLLNRDDFPGCIFIQDLMRAKHQDLPLSAAAFLSARFPYVSPTGKFDEKHHFTDGGTIENSGAETSRQVIEVFESVLAEPQFRALNISINLLSISNSILAAEHPVRDKNMYEIIAPLQGILKTISSNALKADTINSVIAQRNKKYSYNKIQPTSELIGGNWPVLPLGWQISDNALKVMKKSINDQRPKIDKILSVFGTLKEAADTAVQHHVAKVNHQ
ncbi:hypothetical protein [Pedobacter endophyticus]|uniref:Patatin-like phospholipase n=1 Tax=Pedobacter endophyticus TaxID=2789740 RepID=A0A7S9Q0N9_9SPHI|nr:hypothetical protein [Pedobacter endophyticus]QPH40912.1 hypothetical protein IZT61_06505 [Pedobacter endophyticus]